MFENNHEFSFRCQPFHVLFYFSESQDKLGVTSQADFFRRVLGSQTPNTTIIYSTPYLAGNFLYLHSHIGSIASRCSR